MRLHVLDQIMISGVQAEVLRPGDEIEVSDIAGTELLTRHHRAFRAIHQAPAIEPAMADTGRDKKPASTKPRSKK